MEESKLTQEEKTLIENVVDLEIETKELLFKIDDMIYRCNEELNS